MSKATVSVIVPTKNSSATLGECLDSIKAQTYDSKNLEIIVVDNFSSDTTPGIAKKYTKHFFSRGPERSAQRNYAVSKASGKYVVIIDSDMKLDPLVIEQCVEEIEKSSDVVGVIIPEESFGEGFWAQCKKLERSFYVGIPYMEAARFLKKSDFISLDGYDEKMVSGEDWDLSQRLAKKGSLARTAAFIYHNEGRISLFKTIKKKFYYAKLFASYTDKSDNEQNLASQTSILGRYGLFFSHPLKLFKNPILGLGMLFMKTCEFGFGGLGYLIARKKSS
jgi:glycosyltransferase involved in cell wall biosynthesis